MRCFQSAIHPAAVRRMGMTIFQAAALALIVTMAVPAMASTRRTVKMQVTPIYPVAAKNMRISGPVDIDVIVDPNGKVTDVKTLSGDRTLALAATQAVRKWKFAPSSSQTQENVKINFTYNN